MKRLLTITLLTAIIALPAFAQKNADRHVHTSDSFCRAIEKQMAQSLRSDDAGIQSVQLANAIALGTLYRTRVDLSESVPAIIAIHRKSADAELRTRAVAALLAINNADARRYVDNNVSPSEIEMSRAATLEALHAVSSSSLLALN